MGGGGGSDYIRRVSYIISLFCFLEMCENILLHINHLECVLE